MLSTWPPLPAPFQANSGARFAWPPGREIKWRCAHPSQSATAESSPEAAADDGRMVKIVRLDGAQGKLVKLSISAPSGGGRRVVAPKPAPRTATPAAAASTASPAAAPAAATSAAASAAAARPVMMWIDGSPTYDEPERIDVSADQVAQTSSPTLERVERAIGELGLSSAKLWRVRGDYYEQPLAWRRDVLGASSVRQLCKSMLMENTRLSADEAAAAGRLKYVMVVVQYCGLKLQQEKVTEAVRKMEGSRAASRKQYSMRMVDQEVSDTLSGYAHNAVTPVGMSTPVPLICDAPIRFLPRGQLWLGGGEPDVKLRLDVDEMRAKLKPAGRTIEFAAVTA